MSRLQESAADIVPVVKMQGICKRFSGVPANDHINFELRKGEVHALLGENGAGKTTLMNVLYGLYQPDEGEIRVKGHKVRFNSPRDAIKSGLGMVHQHFMLIPQLSALENIILGTKSSKGFLLDVDTAEKKIVELCEKYGCKIDPKAKIWQLSVGEQQRIEIVKALYRGAEILILDEPTAVLTPLEVEDLFRTLRSMIEEGHTIVLITHKLDEALTISDRITVLRDGRVIGTIQQGSATKLQLAEMMVGCPVLFDLTRPPVTKGRVVLEVKSLSALSDKGLQALRDVSFFVLEGEILGICGMAGNGQTELVEVISGLRKASNGSVLIQEKNLTNRPPKDIIAMGVAYVPEDRVVRGSVTDFSIAENAILRKHFESRFTRHLLLDRQAINSFAENLIKEYSIRISGAEASAGELSGGNLQKLLLGRELSEEPKVIIAEQPTHGLDVAATEYVRKRLLEHRERGAGILLLSSELDEIVSLSDRIVVMYEGRIVGTVSSENANIHELGLMMGGTKR